MAIDYLILVFVSSCGVLQLIAAYNTRKGMMIIPVRSLSSLVGIILITSGLLWFFISSPRNIADTSGGLNGNIQAILFIIGAGTALVLTLLITSIINHSLETPTKQEWTGLDILKTRTFYKATKDSIRRWK